MSLLFKNVEVEGDIADVRVHGGRIAEIGRLLPEGEEIVNGRGAALLVGLHDHHLHLLALAADRASVDCSGGLQVLKNATGHWVRGVRARESVDRWTLDQLVPDRPVRVQHRSGGLWMLNSRALADVAAALDDSLDVERDASGEPTGRLWRYDVRLRSALPADPPDLGSITRELLAYGITGVTDATPSIDRRARELLTALPLNVTLLGDTSGTKKLLLRDHDLPTFDVLADVIADAHSDLRPVAVHCVTRESLVLTLAVLEHVGVLAGDRIEHAAVVPSGVAEWMARLRVRVVTQPGFVADRGDDYMRDMSANDQSCLYPLGSLLAAGVPTSVSSDAPYGPLDPWHVIRAARDRKTPRGHVLGPAERITARKALSSYQTDPDGHPRRISPGAYADLVLLHCPLSEALQACDANVVRMAWTRRLDAVQ